MESKVNEPIYKQIALDIAGRIYNNDIKVGQKIHGRSTLASSYNVSPETVRKAVKLLEDMKVVSSSKGSGVTIISKDNAYNFINRFHSIESVTSLKHDIESLMEEKKASYILGLESTSSRMFANAKCFLLQNKIKTQEDVINRINQIDKNDINYVLERCFKPGIISTAFVGQGVEVDKLNSILDNSKVAYKNSIDEKFLL